MNEELPKAYVDLDDSIKLTITPKEFLWMTDAQKAALVRDITEPEF